MEKMYDLQYRMFLLNFDKFQTKMKCVLDLQYRMFLLNI